LAAISVFGMTGRTTDEQLTRGGNGADAGARRDAGGCVF
jgi:hypothetical protein